MDLLSFYKKMSLENLTKKYLHHKKMFLESSCIFQCGIPEMVIPLKVSISKRGRIFLKQIFLRILIKKTFIFFFMKTWNKKTYFVFKNTWNKKSQVMWLSVYVCIK